MAYSPRSAPVPGDHEGIAMLARRRRDTAKKYFWRDIYIGSIPEAHAALKRALATAGATNLQLLQGTPDVQQTMSQETLANALFLWVDALVQREGAAGLERELREPFRKLSEMVAADMKKNKGAEKSAPGKVEPEGVSLPKKRRRPDAKPDKT